MTDARDAGGPGPGCPICGRPPRPEAKPFCSPRCRTVDLGRWLDGGYAIPAEPVPEDDTDARFA